MDLARESVSRAVKSGVSNRESALLYPWSYQPRPLVQFERSGDERTSNHLGFSRERFRRSLKSIYFETAYPYVAFVNIPSKEWGSGIERFFYSRAFPRILLVTRCPFNSQTVDLLPNGMTHITCNRHVYSLGTLEQDQPRDTPGSPDRARGIPTRDARRGRVGSAVARPRDATTPPDARGASDDDGRGATAILVDQSQP